MITTYEYDENGNLERRTEHDPAEDRTIVTEYTYDPDDNLLSQRTEADGIVVETNNAYDINGKLSTQTDTNGNTTSYNYDDADRLVSVTDPLNQTTSYSYTLKGQLETGSQQSKMRSIRSRATATISTATCAS